MRKYRCIKSTDDHKVGDICIVGGYIPEGKFDSEHFNLIQVGTPEEKAWFSQGTIYKNWEAYDKDPSEVCYIPELICYIPEMSDTKYTREDFVRLCGGNEELAREIFLEVDWQHPESLIEEWKVNGELGECKQCGWLFECYGETKCPNWKCPNCGAEWKEEISEYTDRGGEFEVTEVCPHCEREITLTWNVEEDGYQIYCPNCGKVIMLCSMCDRSPCDWTENGCKYSDERYRRNNDGWIPAEEALPECKSLSCDKYGEIMLGYIADNPEGGYMCEMDGVIMHNVIAWQPLPQPYKPERSDNNNGE